MSVNPVAAVFCPAQWVARAPRTQPGHKIPAYRCNGMAPHTNMHRVCIQWEYFKVSWPLFSVVQSWQPLQLYYYRKNYSARMQGKTNVKKVLRGLPSLSASGGKREEHILHSNLFMAPEGPLLPDEGLFSPLVPPLLIDM